MGRDDHNSGIELRLVRDAMQSLAGCAVEIDPLLLRRWFVRAFNHWYHPAVDEGYRGPMALVFDLGMVLCERMGAAGTVKLPENEQQRVYAEFIEQIERSPLLAVAREILDGAIEPAQPWIEGELIGAMLRVFDGVWDERHTPVQRDLPWLTLADAGQTVEVRRGPDAEVLCRLPLEVDAANQKVVSYPQPAAGGKAVQVPGVMPLFYAHVAAQGRNPEKCLDHQVVEACLRAENVPMIQYDPPPLRRVEAVKHTRSTLPGMSAGVTRAEVKLPEDPLISILPSELAPIKAWETSCDSPPLGPAWRRARGLLSLADILLNRKPLVYKRENPRDLVPKHKALVCFITAAGAESPPDYVGDSVHPYSHAYVWAKRQVFDLVRDLREALENVRAYAYVDVDVAVFGVHPTRGITAVHGKFDLQAMPLRRSGEVLADRIKQAMAFDDLIPGFFDLLREKERSTPFWKYDAPMDRMVNPDVGVFLRHEVKRKRPYHAVHLVLAGSQLDLSTSMEVIGRHSGFGKRSRQFLTLISVDLMNGDQRASREGEAGWLFLQSRTTSEASAMLARGLLPRVSLEKLRFRFVESVMGRARYRSSDVRHQIRLT